VWFWRSEVVAYAIYERIVLGHGDHTKPSSIYIIYIPGENEKG
jgi:hypothetical protein